MKRLTKPVLTVFFNPTFWLFLSILIIPGIHTSYANDNITELEKHVSNMQDDTAKVNVLLRLGEYYCSIENDKALMYLQEAFTIATSQNYTSGIGKSLLWQGRVYYYKDDYTLSNKYLDKAKEILEANDELDDLAFLCFAKAAISSLKSDYIHAMKMYEKAIRLTEKTGNTKLMSTCYGGMGAVILNRNEPKRALVYFREALLNMKAIDYQQGISNVYTGIANAFELMGQLDSSLIYHNKALKIRSRLKLDRAIANSEYHQSAVLIKMGKYSEAEESLKKTKSIYVKLVEKTGIIITDVLKDWTNNDKGKADAIDIAKNALETARTLDNPNLISHAYKILSDIFAFNLDYQESYLYLTKHKKLQDSLFNTEKERVITEMEAKFQTEKKDSEIRLLKSKTEIQRKNNMLLIILIVVFAGVIVLLFFMFRLKSTAFKRQQMLREKENIIHAQERKITEKENQILQEQLESKNRELASKALEMLRYNEAISSIIEKLESINNRFDEKPEVMRPIKDIIHELENHTKQNIWNEFEKIFKNIHSGFYDKLLEICPELTATEIKTAALLKLNLTTKEIAAIAFKSEGGIKTTRYRLRKKLGLTNDDKLVSFLMQI